ncbi:MAG: 16S rRNA processing protein RimM [Syntrophomonadaceae bacterium]|nr:16S rRNA processing protein RimM [Syntrophomonadaceae bacterium]
MAGEKVNVGEISGAYGLRGELKVLPLTDFPDRFFGMKEIWVENRRKKGLYGIESVRRHKQFLLFKFEGINDKDSALLLVKGLLQVDEEDVFPLPEDVYYVFQLVGLDVVDVQRGLLGKLQDIISTGANDVYVVQDGKYGEVLIPAIKEVVLEVDSDQGRILVDLLPGLIEEDKK